ncbi:MAG TPA: ribosome biogenesis GTP-binding protein YihA/YsxC [Balneolales bacterium]|nr:ribosome biogenesis GTP-binding protein YihA/YsxC [Balneolales bacterium]
MEITDAKFILSAPTIEMCPESALSEVCFAGRSNVGKSSLINILTNRKKLARTSNTPGKTQLLNFYSINNDLFYLVDLPGYGYAKVSQKKKSTWGKEMQRYLKERSQIRMIFQLIDIRHDPTRLDEDFIFWMAENHLPFSIIMTKADKLSKNKQQKSLARLKHILDDMNIEVPIVISSAHTRKGTEEILSIIEEFI